MKIVRDGILTKNKGKRSFLILFFICFCAILLLFSTKNTDKMIDKDLIPREVIFGNPDKMLVKTSPDGKNTSYIAPLNGVLNIFIAKDNKLEESQAITNDTHRGIRSYLWTYDSKFIIYSQDTNGDENAHLFKVDLDSGAIVDLTPFPGAKAHLEKLNKEITDYAVVSINDRRKDFFDLYLVNLKTNENLLIYKNDLYDSLYLDEEFNLRFAEIPQKDSGRILYKFEENSAIKSLITLLKTGKNPSDTKKLLETIQSNQVELFMEIPPTDIYTTGLAGFTKDYNKVYFVDSRGKDKAELVLMDLETKENTVLFQKDEADIDSMMQNPITKELEAVSWTYAREKWHFFDERVAKVFKLLNDKSEKPGEIQIVSRSLDDKNWIAAVTSDISSANYYRLNFQKTGEPEITFLFTGDSKLDKYQLSKMHSLVIKAQDGLNLVSYLTLPKTLEYKIQEEGDLIKEIQVKEAAPLVLYVHGGPTARDEWGLNPIHQWLADRGYAVLSVNYRGSTGFGKDFIMKGDGEWAKKMHQDLLDAANWAVAKGITKQDTIAIMGGSYGGYAALVGLTFTPDFFNCAVDIVGPSNLQSLIETIPDDWKPALESLNKKITGKVNPKPQDFIDRSPITYVDRISKPLLIGHGANDPRVKQAESDQIVKSMQEKNIPVIYALYPDEGHGFTRPENRLSFFLLTEYFLHENLKGRLESLDHDFHNSSLEIKAGLELLPEEVAEELS
jgi:dipeptidyl aminopeptidase/acylaminoacyl peptidase